jgi:branched-chain amino acid transport system permease protein
MYLLPLTMGDYGLSLLIPICAFAIGMQGLQIITGFCGQISLGHAAFMGAGFNGTAKTTVPWLAIVNVSVEIKDATNNVYWHAA